MAPDSLHFSNRPRGYYVTVILMFIFTILSFVSAFIKIYILTAIGTMTFLLIGIYGLWKYEKNRPKYSEGGPLSWIITFSILLIFGIVLLFIEEFPQDKRYAVLLISFGIAGISYGLYRYFIKKAGKSIIITTGVAIFLFNVMMWAHHFTVVVPKQIEREMNYAMERKKTEERMKKESERFERLMEDPLREIIKLRIKEKYGITIPEDIDWSKIDTSDIPLPVIFYSHMQEKPEPIDIPLPYLPPVLHVERVKAYVIVRAIIDTDGKIIEAEIHTHKAYSDVELERLDSVVIEAVKKIEYTPPKHNGKPVKVRVLISYVLRKGKWEIFPDK